jgi:hypothetical protein
VAEEPSFDLLATLAGPTAPDRIAEFLQSLYKLFLELESVRLGRDVRRSHFRWDAGDIHVPFVGSSNGLNREALTDLAVLARTGFQHAQQDRRQEDWPSTFNYRAQLILSELITQSDVFSSYAISVDGDTPVIVAPQAFDPDNPANKRQWSSIEGTLRGMTDYGHYVEARLREKRVGRVVRCRFEDPYVGDIERFFRKNVLIYGLVTYSPDDEPIYVSRITGVEERQTRSKLRPFLGMLPGLVQGESQEEFLDRTREG